MGYLSKRRGVISVFLLLIFMVTYVFMGLLVDAGRYRMAQTYVESALDNASSSVLSSYNKMVFDLYGLFCVDIEAEDGKLDEKIEEVYNNYLQETLGIIGVDTSKYKTLLNEVLHANEQEANKEKKIYNTKTLYDFQITELDAGTSITLADTANVENQIIEYMKFRAPVELMNEVESFLKILNSITQMEERVAAAQEKREITKKYENNSYSVSENANDVLLHVDDFMRRLKATVVSYDGSEVAYNCFLPIEQFENEYSKVLSEYSVALREAKDIFCSDIKGKLQELQEYLKEKGLEIGIDDLYKEGDSVDFTTIDIDLNTEGTGANAMINLNLLLKITAEVTEELDDLINAYENLGGNEEYIEKFESYGLALTLIYEQYHEANNAAHGTYYTKKETALSYLVGIKEKEDEVGMLFAEAYPNGGAGSLYEQLSNVNTTYKAYLQDLENKKATTSNASDKAMYDTDIQQIKANAALILERMELLKAIKPYFENISYQIGSAQLLSTTAKSKAEVITTHADTDEGTAESLCSYFGFKYGKGAEEFRKVQEAAYKQPSNPNPEKLLETVQKSLLNLLSAANSYEPVGHSEGNDDVQKVKNETIDSDEIMKNAEKISEEKAPSEEQEEVSLVHDNFNVDMLKVSYQTTQMPKDGYSIQDEDELIPSDKKLTMDVFDTLLSAASALITQLGGMLTEARDNLYVDAYIMSTFPNYYSHYQKRDENKEDKLVSGPYKDYNASLAEVEFIITGGNPSGDNLYKVAEWAANPADFGTDSVEAIKGRLFGIRLVLNAVSMFTDPGRYSQAMTISSWAGPFAPLVAAVLMIGWTVAETALDVLVLTGEDNLGLSEDGTVLLYKGTKDWFISVGGVLQALLNAGLDAVANALISEADALASSLETEVNAMVYDVYTAINDGTEATLDSAMSTVQQKGDAIINDWTSKLETNLNTTMDSAGISEGVQGTVNSSVNRAKDTMNSQFEKTLNTGKEKITGAVEVATGEVKTQTTLAVAELKKQVLKSTEAAVNDVATSAKDFISEHISDVIPSSDSATGSFVMRLNYEHYLYIFLFLMDTETKLQRVQAVIQANMRVGGQDKFSMENAPVSVWADLEVSMKYMFMSDGIVPESMKKDGRLRLKVISAQSY